MHSTSTTSSTLSASDLRILDTAHLPPIRRQEISVELGLGLVGATMRLLELLDDPAALQARPVLVHRLRRLREQRRAARSARRLAWA